MAQSPIIEAIKGKIDKVVADNKKLRNDLVKVTDQNNKLTAEKKALILKIAEMEKRIGVLEMAEGMSAGSGDKDKARARVNRLMREVDKCIALLNR